ncbi:MAG TPA: hypothetical protein ENG06_05665 [Thermoplasmatales archaeon]|nr:hypothetical protein [Thermoplasmatales archaeon]
MSKSPHLLDDIRGIVAWLISQIGLLLAAGVLIASIASLTFYSDWQKEAEAKAIASEIATAIETMDLKSESNITPYVFPFKNYHYNVTISTEYVTVMREGGTFTDVITAREALLIKPFIRPAAWDLAWNTSEELYDFLWRTYGGRQYAGNDTHPFPLNNENLVKQVKQYFSDELARTALQLARQPLRIEDTNEPIFLEKALIYFKHGNGDLDTMGIVIIHQEVPS